MHPWVLSLLLIFLAPSVFSQTYEILYPGTAQDEVLFASNINGWGETPIEMNFIPGRGHSLILKRPLVEKIVYKLVVNGRWQRDRLNPRVQRDSAGRENSLIIPETNSSPLTLKPRRPLPRPLKRSLRLFNKSKVDYYLVKLNRNSTRPPIQMVFLDGEDFLNKTKILWVLKNLSRQISAPLHALFLPPKNRMREYAQNNSYSRRLVQEILPQLGFQAHSSIIIGVSLSGLQALHTSLRYPREFPHVISLSGSFWWNGGKILEDIERSSQTDGLWFLEYGSLEGAGITGSHRKIEELIPYLSKPIHFQENLALHDWFHWSQRIPYLLNEVVNSVFRKSKQVRRP